MTSWLDRLQRKVSGKRYFPEIDGLRFLAIFGVLLLHFQTQFVRVSQGIYEEIPVGSWLYWLCSKGGAGVPLFFAISGYVLYKPFHSSFLEGKNIKLSKYFLKRLVRIEPPYIIIMVGLYLAYPLFFGGGFLDELPHLLFGLAYVHLLVYGVWNPINPVSWSLEAEVQFYLLAPLIFKIGKLSSSVRVVVWTLIIVFGVLLIRDQSVFLKEYHLDKSLVRYLHYFIVGVFIVEVLDEEKARSYLWDLVMIIGFYFFFLFEWPSNVLIKALGGDIALGVFMYSVFRSRLGHKLFSVRLFTVFGGMCYTIYLIHYPFYVFVMSFLVIRTGVGYFVDFLVNSFVFILLLALVSVAVFCLVERPFMNSRLTDKLLSWWNNKRINPRKKAILN